MRRPTQAHTPDSIIAPYVLRAGDAPATEGAIPILCRVIARLRKAFPGIIVRVRLDGGFAAPEVFDYLDRQGVDYAVAMGKNEVLKAEAEPLMEQARTRSSTSGETEHLYGECLYQAGSWEAERRVIFKAEVVRHPGREPKDNPRFVVTNIRRAPRSVYEKIYCQRASVENRIKELLYGLNIDRTSCTRFFANQLRCLLCAAAYGGISGGIRDVAQYPLVIGVSRLALQSTFFFSRWHSRPNRRASRLA